MNVKKYFCIDSGFIALGDLDDRANIRVKKANNLFCFKRLLTYEHRSHASLV